MAESGYLGKFNFPAGGSVDSELLVPEKLSTGIAIYAVPDQPGTAQLFLVDKEGRAHPFNSPPQAGIAFEMNMVQINAPLFGAIAGAFLRYTNTNATAGVVFFAGSSGS